MKKKILAILFCFSISCFAQQPKVMADGVDRACEGYVAEIGPCAKFGDGLDVGFLEIATVLHYDKGLVHESCLRSHEKDKSKLLKIVFTCNGFHGKFSYSEKVEFYYAEGKAFYAKVKTEKFKRRRKTDEKTYEFELNSKLPDDIDPDTKKWLEDKIKELL